MMISRPTALATGTALAAAMLAGCSGMGSVKSASAGLPESPLASSKESAKLAKAVTKAEADVARAPDSAPARAALGQAYLAAGRFISAATTLDDAMRLGDSSGRTALSLALAKLGSGDAREAVAILDDWRGEIPASDLGLALALSGETSRGVAVLADALRGGEDTPKLRQNLAYAYALDGRWTEAKLMAAQDVPADQLDKRLAYWALSMLPDRGVERVAALIGAPAQARDPGQPAALALNVAPAAEAAPQMAVAEPVAAPAAMPAPAAPAAAAAAPVELPAVAAPTTVDSNALAQRQLAPQPVAPQPVVVRSAAMRPAAIASVHPRLAVPARKPAAPMRPLVVAVAPVSARPAAPGSHFVQLGAFSSQQGARRAWGVFTKRDPGLAAYRMTILPATVRGKQVWRVAAGGLTGRIAATSLCSKLKASGGACFAYSTPVRATPAAGRPVVPALAVSGPARARR